MANQANFPVRTQCRVLQVSPSSFFAWHQRPPSRREMKLIERIRTIRAESDGTYGRARIRAEVIDQGVKTSSKRVARLMCLAGQRGVSRHRGFVVTTRRDHRQGMICACRCPPTSTNSTPIPCVTCSSHRTGSSPGARARSTSSPTNSRCTSAGALA
ncbi:IS3 family transposase [Zoogloea sp.]|uniref:IS3 family transposase n=1 Tax=Zoogloea sp. TaxID=49181 RepID=UPI0035B2D0C6